jgi:hypothetical protein
MADEQAGWPSRETDSDHLINKPGSHQWLGHDANHHGDSRRKAPDENRLLPGTKPEVSGPAFGPPDQVNPLGRQFPASLEED